MRMRRGSSASVRANLFYGGRYIPKGAVVLIASSMKDADGISYVCRMTEIPRSGSRFPDVVKLGETARLRADQLTPLVRSSAR